MAKVRWRFSLSAFDAFGRGKLPNTGNRLVCYYRHFYVAFRLSNAMCILEQTAKKEIIQYSNL